MENENEIVVPETTEEVVPETTENTEQPVEESVEEIKARLAKAEELANNYKIRAEKAEKKPKEVIYNAPAGTSTKDLVALMNAKVSEEDIGEVEEFARFKKISIAEALKSTTVQSILRDKAEQRKTAEATNTGSSRRSTSKVSDEFLVSNARSGKLPENEEDIQRLIRAKMGFKK